MRSGFLAKALGEAAHQILKDIAAVNRADLVGTEIAVGRVEFLDYKVQAAALDHALDHCVKIEFGQHVLHVRRKACKIVAEVGFDILGVGKQLVKGELACVVELIARGLRQEAVDDREVLYLFVCILNRLPCGSQAVVKPLYDRHRKNDQAVFVRLEITEQVVSNVPYHRCLFSYVCSDYIDFIV